MQDFIDPYIFNETAKLEAAGSPYDIFAMTWSMADNCLIDADLPEAVREWNEKYAYPKLIISGTKEIMAAYEARYAAIIPEVKGDFTEFWTNGLGSDARRIGMSRRAKEELVQGETLGILINAPVEHNAVDAAWENILLGAEHTWGFQDPRAPMAKKVEAVKAGYFEQAGTQSAAILKNTLGTLPSGNNTFAVINTLSWTRSGLITLTPEQSAKGSRIVDELNKEVVTQRMENGDLVFLSGEIPALGAKMYTLLPGNNNQVGTMAVAGNRLNNGAIELTVNRETGNITGLTDLRSNWNYADNTKGISINSYNYVEGVYNGKDTVGKPGHDSNINIAIKENGPLVASMVIISTGKGTKGIRKEIRLIKDRAYVEITNTIDKIPTMEKEGIHWGFAFNIPNGEIKMDIPMGVIRPEKDQLAGANKNWLPFQRWVDISNGRVGVTFTSIESPLIEIGAISGNILDGARLARRWLKRIPASQTVYSWQLNNHWDTNFPLQQGGMISTTYGIAIHDGHTVADANRFGVEQHRPLLVVKTDVNPVKMKLAVDNPKVMIAALKRSADNKALIVHLRSLSDTNEEIKLTSDTSLDIFSSDASEKQLNKIRNEVVMAPYGFTILRINNL